jgi:hypothetical protein
MCPLQETKKIPKPEIFLTGNKAIYSTPEETHLYVKCSHHTQAHTYTDETISINGTGEVTFKPSCAVTLPGGATFNTPAAVHEQEVNESRLFEILRRDYIPTNIVINRIPDNFPTLPTIILQEIDQYQDIWQQTIQPDTLKPFAIRMAVIAVVILGLTILCYCCCPTQTKDCCKLICWVTRRGRKKKPKKNSYDLQEARQNDILLHKLSAQMDELSNKTANPEPKRWTSAGQLFTTFGKTSRSSLKNADVSMDKDEIDNPIPPPIGSPHISYKIRDLEQALQNSPTAKRVQFDTAQSDK